jgi:Ras-related protein Rab-1A
MEYDFLFKVLLVGQTNVGKTALLQRFIDDKFYDQSFSTIGVDYKLKTVEILVKEVHKVAKLQLWDTAGQERFHSITTSYFRGAHGVMLVFALDDIQTFKKVRYWIDIVQDQHNDVAYKILIGNKNDLKPHQVTDEMITAFMKEYPDIRYMETSAKTGHFVEDVFKEMATVLAERMSEARQMAAMENNDKNLPKVVNAQPDKQVQSNNKCCGGTG